MDKNKFKEFFQPYAENVDNANSLSFWKLSDALILEIIKRNIGNNINEDSIMMDAGGGTGRWITNLSKEFNCKFVLYDLSEDMLKKAKENISIANIEDRVTILQGDLCDMSKLADNTLDCIVSIYSPISFIYDNKKATQELYRVLNPGGKIIIMGHGYYNAIASKINNYTASPNELDTLNKTQYVRWGEHVPELVTYSKESMEKMLIDEGFSIISTYGVPVFVQPGVEDFDPSNSKKSVISKALDNDDFFKKVFDLEMEHNNNPLVANRGMNIFTVAKK
jgi:ubiquinone/menaquinone biosynthesis C-methylase UbiE